MFSCACEIEVGDTVQLDLSKLNVSNTNAGCRDDFNRKFEVTNRKIDFKTGKASLDLTDLSFDENECRQGCVAPSSCFNFNSESTSLDLGVDEAAKWCADDAVCLYDENCVLSHKAKITHITNGLLTLHTSLPGFILGEKVWIDLDTYCEQNDCNKSLFTFVSSNDGAGFADGGEAYCMT